MLSTLVIKNPGERLDVSPLENLECVDAATFVPFVLSETKEDMMDRTKAMISIGGTRILTREEIVKVLNLNDEDVIAHYKHEGDATIARLDGGA